jgi:hypothetical protein
MTLPLNKGSSAQATEAEAEETKVGRVVPSEFEHRLLLPLVLPVVFDVEHPPEPRLPSCCDGGQGATSPGTRKIKKE